MIITSAQNSDFDHLLISIDKFHRKFCSDSESGEGVILVDLMHNHTTVLMLNLLSALYVAQKTSSSLIGLTTCHFIGHEVPMKRIRQLSAAFGIRDIVVLDAPKEALPSPTVQHVLDEAEATINRWASLQEDTLRHNILSTTLNGCLIGDLVYDNYLYECVEATIRQPSSILNDMLRRAALILGRMQDLLAERSVDALLVSHTVYIEYGVPTRAALQMNKTVYGKIGLDPIGIRRYENIDEATIFPGNVTRFDIEYYKSLFGTRFNQCSDNFFPPTPEKNDGSDFYRYGYGCDKREEPKSRLLRELGIDPKKKNAIIMAHQFTDACHCYPDCLYDDYYVWLDETLRIASKVQNVNWLLRQHPYERMIGQGRHFNELAEKYQESGNIYVVPPDITTSSLFNCVDVLITVAGSAGLEFASVGVPCILAGNPFYANFGFTDRPGNRLAYEEALHRAAFAVRLSPDKIARAKEVAFVSYRCMRLSSSYIPYAQDLEGRELLKEESDKYWYGIAERLSCRPFYEDPLYLGMQALYIQQHPTMLNDMASILNC